MESASDRSPDPNRTKHDASHPLLAHMRLHPISSPGSPPACRLSPHALQDVDPASGQIIRNSWATRMSEPLGWNAALRSVGIG